jgi:hypothetical protein
MITRITVPRVSLVKGPTGIVQGSELRVYGLGVRV